MVDKADMPSNTADDAADGQAPETVTNTESTESTETPETTDAAEAPAPTDTKPVNEDEWSDNAKAAQQANKEKFGKLKDFGRAYWRKKKWTLPATVVVLLAILLGVPFTRYTLLGLFVHNQTKVVVFDAKTHKPVSGADVIIGSATAKTDLGGNVLISPKLGNKTLLVSKKYYTSVSQPVTITWPSKLAQSVSLTPTGRLVPITLTNNVTGKPVADALVKAAGTETHTDKAGRATIVLPTISATQKASISLNGFNTSQITIQVTDQMVAGNNFTLTPTGKLYFLSNRSGKIDVVKTDLDGQNRQTIFAGTGNEDIGSTSLLASRDWKYLALLAKHDATSQSLYLINTSNDQVTNIDGGSATASFSLVGWANDTFVYEVIRSNVNNWQSGAQALKSYDASASKLYTIDQTQGEGTGSNDYGYNNFTQVYILDENVVYAKNWYASYMSGHLNGKSDSLITVNPDGTNKKTVKDFTIPDNSTYFYTTLQAYEPSGIYIQVAKGDGTYSYFTYEDGKISDNTTLTSDTFNKGYATYLESPSGKQFFWSEVRDNKNSLFVGDDPSKNPKQIASLSDYVPYGWYTDNYLLVSKNGSELYIMTPDGSGKPKKVTDYYKPQLTYRGYGGGYGGQ